MGIKIFALVVLITIAAFFLAVFVALGRLPGQIAEQRNHPSKDAIRIGGWVTLIAVAVGWPFVLMWAYSKPARVAVEDDEVERLREEVAELRQKLRDAGGEA